MAVKKEFTITITIEDEQIFDILDNNEIKASQAKVNKLKKLFKDVEADYYDQLEEALTEILEELALEEWGE